MLKQAFFFADTEDENVLERMEGCVSVSGQDYSFVLIRAMPQV